MQRGENMLQCKGVRICYNAKRGEYVTMQRGENILQCKGVRICYNGKQCKQASS